MFTGLIQDVGVVREVRRGEPLRLAIETSFDALVLGESIAIDGTCLTVVAKSGKQFSAEATGETLAKTALSDVGSGTKVNLERAVALGDRLGGHLVLGHVDGAGRVCGVSPQGGGRWLEVEAPPSVVPFLLEKGSIAVDGVSLTINAVEGSRFQVMLIPETLARTTLGALVIGSRVNLEGDIIGKYVARLLGVEGRLGVSRTMLERAGFA
jgi:riboflavin synthase